MPELEYQNVHMHELETFEKISLFLIWLEIGEGGLVRQKSPREGVCNLTDSSHVQHLVPHC